jgi:hypothetical protein
MITDPQVEAYVRAVRAHLGSATASEEEEVVREINSRIQELAAEPGATPQAVLEQLGPAKKLARQYRDSLLIAKACKSVYPPLLLHASLRNGIAGVFAYLVGVAGYGIGGMFAVIGLLALAWSVSQYAPEARAAMGFSVLECIAALVTGAVLIVLTTLLLRAVLRSSKKARKQN